jgi:UDP-N-acetylmuramoyl-tripeptide--D-alanyl-D-alanine ligase
VLEGATADTLLVANADDARVTARLGRFAGRVVTFGIDRDADVRAMDVVDRGIAGMRARVASRRGADSIETPLVGRANLSNVLAATAVALEMDVPLAEIVRRAAGLRPPPHRGEIARLRNGVTVIDDSYNANPAAMKRALEVLAAASGTRRVAVLGEMLELGDHAEHLHAEVGAAVTRSGADVLVCVGGAAAEAMARAAVEKGMPAGVVQYFATSDEAAPAVVGLVRSGDVLLVKGSRGVKTDRIVDALKAAQG